MAQSVLDSSRYNLSGYGGPGRRALRAAARERRHEAALAHRADVDAGVTDDFVASVFRYTRASHRLNFRHRTTGDLAAWCLRRYGLVLRALRALARRGVVVEEERPGRCSVWRLA